jgi:hypothetical protein
MPRTASTRSFFTVKCLVSPSVWITRRILSPYDVLS